MTKDSWTRTTGYSRPPLALPDQASLLWEHASDYGLIVGPILGFNVGVLRCDAWMIEPLGERHYVSALCYYYVQLTSPGVSLATGNRGVAPNSCRFMFRKGCISMRDCS